MTPRREEVVHSPSMISPTSYYHANRNGLSTVTPREPKISSTAFQYSKPPLSSNPIITGNAIIDHIRQQDRMRAHREANSSSGSSGRSGRSGSTSSLDRVGLSSSSSTFPPFSNGDSSYSRSRPIYGPSRTYSSSENRRSILEPSDILKPVASSIYDRSPGYSRTTSSASDRESLYDYSTPKRSGSLSRGGYNREDSLDRSRGTVKVTFRSIFVDNRRTLRVYSRT